MEPGCYSHFSKFKVSGANHAYWLGESDDPESLIWRRHYDSGKVFTPLEFEQALEKNPWLREADLWFFKYKP